MSRTWQPQDGQQLKSLREGAGLERSLFARQSSLSDAQLRELEEGGQGCFYSALIKLSVGRRLLQRLGGELTDPDSQLGSDGLPVRSAVAPSLAATSSAATPLAATSLATTTPALAAHKSSAPSASERRWGLLSSVALAAGVVAVMGWWSAPEQQASMQQAPLQQSTAQQAPLQPALATAAVAEAPALVQPSPAELLPAAAPTQSQAPLQTPRVAQLSPLDCPVPGDAPTALRAPTADKPSNYVHLVARREASLCLMDGQGRVSRHRLEPGEARSVYGSAPWKLFGPDLSAIQLYFQGNRIDVPAGADAPLLLQEYAARDSV